MFGKIGIPELILILVIALIIFGPRKLPEIGRAIGSSLREFKQATQEVAKSVNFEDTGQETKKETLVEKTPNSDPVDREEASPQ